MVAAQDASLLKLRQDPINRGQADVGAVLQQDPEHVLCRHVALRPSLENLQNFQPR